MLLVRDFWSKCYWSEISPEIPGISRQLTQPKITTGNCLIWQQPHAPTAPKGPYSSSLIVYEAQSHRLPCFSLIQVTQPVSWCWCTQRCLMCLCICMYVCVLLLARKHMPLIITSPNMFPVPHKKRSKYFGPLHTAYTAHIQYLQLSILFKTLFFSWY